MSADAGARDELPRRRGHALDARGDPRARRAGRGARRRAADPRAGAARRHAPAWRSTSATRARCCGCCRAGSPASPRAAAGRSTATRAIRRRPVDRVAEPLRADGRALRGARRAASRRSRSPAAPLRGIEYALPVASAQVKSCVLLAGLLADGRDDRGRARAEPRPHGAAAARAPAPASRATATASRSAARTSCARGDRTSPATRRRPPSTPPPRVLVPGSRLVIDGHGGQLDARRLLPDPAAHGRRRDRRARASPRRSRRREPVVRARRGARRRWSARA